MDLEEREAKVCRLCGQHERLYVDVFGEEGEKRYLSLKIHARLNILTDEGDLLPKAICVQCLGKLEFVCDFYEECWRTQHELRARYNLPELTEFEEVKEETPSAKSSDNNNSIEKNLNSTSNENTSHVKDAEQKQQRVLRNTAKSQRSLRSNQQVSKCNDETNTEENLQISQSTHSTETTSTRWLRSRQSAESVSAENGNNEDDDEEIPIANRLRSHNNNNADNNNQAHRSSPSSNSNSDNESIAEKQLTEKQQQDLSSIQLPTSVLNKLLTIFSSVPEIEVSVKESRYRGSNGGDNNSSNNNSDAEDISFTVELCKKSSEDNESPTIRVRARVFPDQGSCLVDTAIIDLLQSIQSSIVEVNGIVSSILGCTTAKNGNADAVTKLKDLAELEQTSETIQKPEELFRIDGEEIKVDDNVEHVTNDCQTGYMCKLCRKFYERKDKCTVHVKTHLGIKQYTCIVCNSKFVCKSDVMKHIRCSHTNPRPVQCPKCPKRFKSKFYLNEHDNVHKGVRPYCCSDCGQSYHHKVSLQIHMKSHLPPQNLACEYCGKVFPYRTRLLSHIASVHVKKRRNFRCRFCYNLYSSLAVLNEHIKTRHATTYTCETCGKTFKVASKYKAHVLQHSNPKPFICNICNNRYASKAFLNEHLLKHEGLRKHVCQKCGAAFAQASHLAAHRYVHGEKTHACPECGRKFNRRDNMKVHRKRHFEQKKSGAAIVASKQKSTTSSDHD